MNKLEFIKYTAKKYNIDNNAATILVDSFAESLQELLASGRSVTIDEIGEFKSTPLFPEGINIKGKSKSQVNSTLARIEKRNMISFSASEACKMQAV